MLAVNTKILSILKTTLGQYYGSQYRHIGGRMEDESNQGLWRGAGEVYGRLWLMSGGGPCCED